MVKLEGSARATARSARVLERGVSTQAGAHVKDWTFGTFGTCTVLHGKNTQVIRYLYVYGIYHNWCSFGDRLRRTEKAIEDGGRWKVSVLDTVNGCRRQRLEHAYASERHAPSLSYLNTLTIIKLTSFKLILVFLIFDEIVLICSSTRAYPEKS